MLLAVVFAGCGPSDREIDAGDDTGRGDTGRSDDVGPSDDTGVALDAAGDTAASMDATTDEDAAERCPERSCRAVDAASFRTCFDRVGEDEVDEVQVAARISCSGPGACAGVLRGIARPVWVHGTTADAGLHRTDSYTYPLLLIDGSSDVTVSDLALDEGVNACDASPCSSTVVVLDSMRVRFERLDVSSVKVMGIEGARTEDLVVRDSTFTASGVHAIWLANWPDAVSGRVRIENNHFVDGPGNAILFAAIAAVERPSHISGNTFVHNHYDALYDVCGPAGDTPCPGGQLLIEHQTRHLVIENNVIRDGRLERYPDYGISGIEFAPADISDVIVAHNDIHDNTGAGIIMNVPTEPTVARVTIQDNRLYGNGSNIVFPGATSSGNCTSADCPFVLPTGDVSAAPNPCVLPEPDGACTSTLSWSSAEARAIQVLVDGTGVFSVNPGGVQDAPWIGAAPARFELYGSATLLAEITVRGTHPDACPP